MYRLSIWILSLLMSPVSSRESGLEGSQGVLNLHQFKVIQINISEHKARELARLKAIPQHCFQPACPILQKWGELPVLWGGLASGSCSGDPTPRVSLSSSACSQIPLPSKPSLNALLLHLTSLGTQPQAPSKSHPCLAAGPSAISQSHHGVTPLTMYTMQLSSLHR